MTTHQAARVPWRDVGFLRIAVFLEFLAMGLVAGSRVTCRTAGTPEGER